jgi:hypothetical protein
VRTVPGLERRKTHGLERIICLPVHFLMMRARLSAVISVVLALQRVVEGAVADQLVFRGVS